jgi:hypothetical protein
MSICDLSKSYLIIIHRIVRMDNLHQYRRLRHFNFNPLLIISNTVELLIHHHPLIIRFKLIDQSALLLWNCTNCNYQSNMSRIRSLISF